MTGRSAEKEGAFALRVDRLASRSAHAFEASRHPSYRRLGRHKCRSQVNPEIGGARPIRRLVDLLAREARGRGIAAHDRVALLERQHVVDAAEAVGRARFDCVDDALGAAFPVHPHDLRRHRQAFLLVHRECVQHVLGGLQPVGEAAGVEDRLRCAVGADRVHRVGGVAEQGDAAVRPARQRIAVAHRIFPEFGRRLDQRLRVDVGDAEALDVRHQVFEPSGPRPIFLVRRRGGAVADAGDHRPVRQPPVRPRGFGDRIDDELCGHAAGDHHGAAGKEGRPFDRAAPEHGAVPPRGPLVGIERVAHQRVNAVGAHQHVSPRGRAMRAVAVEEVGGHAALVLAKGAQAMSGMDARFP